ncbi:MAG: ATP-dependent Clp protease ATP-binding subunit [Acidobacteria bacterium]|nr:ATP-dependent Clp protease ATP-binding subunit [Acidobacteriota bacterium]
MIKANELREQLRKEVIGQEKAVEALVQAVVIADLGICDPQRPLGTFLFLGPTGTGKSQLGRSLAKALHGDEKEVLAINCTEFQNPHDVAKLVGAPPGYVGHEHPPFITPEKLAKRFTIIIFEELEKADRTFFDLLLQVLERGEMTTGAGVHLDFTNCFLIMTSNVCAKEVDDINKGVVGFHPPGQKICSLPFDSADVKIQSTCMNAVGNFFSPEFLNRVDEIITFNRLKEEHLMAILNKFLLDTRARLAMVGIGTVIDEQAKRFLIRRGSNVRYGARPLRRALRQLLEFPLAKLVAEQGLDRNQAIHITADEERLSFRVEKLCKGQVIGSVA